MTVSVEEFARAWHHKRTIREVAATVGMSTTATVARARKLRLPRKPRNPIRDPEAVKRVQDLRREGLTFRQIAAVTGKHLAYVHRYACTVPRGVRK